MSAQRCNKHETLMHDFFISYRVSTDSVHAEQLAALLDGKKRNDGNNILTYLDKNCLIQGKNWEEGFTYGINHSSVILLLISKGLISTIINKALRGEVDNVMKEYAIALDLKAKGRLVVPVYVASKGYTKENREGYIKFNTRAAIREFEKAPPEATEKLTEAKQILEEIFRSPKFVHVEPNSLQEQIPNIIQLWHKRQKISIPRPNRLLHPTQSFRLTFIGTLIGFLLPIFTMSILFVPSKSKRHSAIKYGVAIGNTLATSLAILFFIAYGSTLFFMGHKMECTSCESLVLDNEALTVKYVNQKTGIENIFKNHCNRTCDGVISQWDNVDNRIQVLQSDITCLTCGCGKIYKECRKDENIAKGLLVAVPTLSLVIIIITVITTSHAKSELFS